MTISKAVNIVIAILNECRIDEDTPAAEIRRIASRLAYALREGIECNKEKKL